MTTEVIITGTGSPVPDAERAGPGVLVRCGDIVLQFDAGRSTVQRLAALGMWHLGLTAFFVTHHHSDHLSGLADIVLSHWVMARDDEFTPLRIVVPRGPAADYVSEMLHPWRHDLEVRAKHARRSRSVEMEITAFEPPQVATEVWRRGEVIVSAAQVRHEPVFPAVGYRVSTPDGDIVISGDTLVCDEVAQLASGAEVLVYEAMLFDEIRRGPKGRHFILDYHADARLIGRQAAELGVPTLVLTHLIPAPTTDATKKADTGATDTGATDTGATDTGATDTGAADTGATDTGIADTGLADTELAVSGVTESDYEELIRAGGFEGDLLVARDLDAIVLEAGAATRIERRS